VKKLTLRGTGTAIVTPFKKDGSIDYDAFKRIVDMQIAGGVEMLVPLGSTGENPTITREERTQIFRWIVEYVDHRALVIAGTGTNDTRVSIEFTREAKELGADACIVVTPFYNKPTPNGLYEHFKAVADVGLPVLMYNVPGRTGLNMLADTTLRCAEIENVVSIKEASADLAQCMEIIHHAPEGFTLLSGEDFLTVPLISVGAEGVVSVVSNEVPKEFSDMVRFALAGKFNDAMKLHYKLLDLMKINFIESNPGPVKAALAMMNVIDENLRLPLVAVKPESKESIRKVLRALSKL
jgi:4-hydroxy-tetrahydrodipicolinate synthase